MVEPGCIGNIRNMKWLENITNDHIRSNTYVQYYLDLN